MTNTRAETTTALVHDEEPTNLPTKALPEDTDISDLAELRWPPRVSKRRIRQLYLKASEGIIDEELIDDVGYALYLRCQAILTVKEAREVRVACPRCEREGNTTLIPRQHGALNELLICPACSWQITWMEYLKTFKRRQLHSGGAVPAFQSFIQSFDRARDHRQKLIAIDRVIHEFHYSLRKEPDLPTRAAAVNLIDGRLSDVMAFLDSLTYGDASIPEMADARTSYQHEVQRLPWNPLR